MKDARKRNTLLGWDPRRLAPMLAALVAGPLLATFALEELLLYQGGSSSLRWGLRLLCLFLGLATALMAAIFVHRRLTRQVDALIEQCHHLALTGPQTATPAPQSLAELGRLGLAIQVLRDVLVDYLNLYRRFFEAAPDMFLSLSPAGGRILDANQAFCRAVGRLRSEVLGHSVEEFVELDKGWQAAFQGEEGFHQGQIHTQGGIIEIEASISWERGPQGQLLVLGAILRDVTQREELHRRLLAKSTELERALEEIKSVETLKDQFLTTLSHELKTPLVALKGFMELLARGVEDPNQRAKYFQICQRNLDKLEKQINNLLDLARLSHDPEQFAMERVDLAAVLRTSLENLKPLADERKVTLHPVPLESFPVRGNLEKLTQLVDNLLLNAIKYNKEGGEVRLGLERRDERAILSVSDSGVGIQREQMARIFNRFYRADLAGTGRIEGLGIGLSLVQEIVKLHGGDIAVTSIPGQGTTFTVELEAMP